jgi:prepilin peptidase CpaA
MHHLALSIWCTVLTTILVGAAIITDLRWRRIPNYLTLPAFGLALITRAAIEGWGGLGLAILGAVLSPLVLFALHGGKGIGMGDLKLATAIGAIVGPVMAATMMLLSAVIGGIQAIVIMFRSGGLLSQLLGVLLVGLPGKKKENSKDAPSVCETPNVTTMPYGVAIGIGSLLTLAVRWWTGQENWFLSFVKIAASP